MPKAVQYAISLEIGKQKTFASAVDWPGWCRSGRNEAAALQALLLYSPRYAKVLHSTGLEILIPEEADAFNIIERVDGDAATDFGVPNLPTRRDAEAIRADDTQRFATILKACWLAFDQAARSARDKELRKGPRGGGRDLDAMISHVIGAEAGYLRQLGWDVKKTDADLTHQVDFLRSQVLDGLSAAVGGQLAKVGPRGGKRWSPRYFIRRSCWHVLDHAWEIEDRII